MRINAYAVASTVLALFAPVAVVLTSDVLVGGGLALSSLLTNVLHDVRSFR